MFTIREVGEANARPLSSSRDRACILAFALVVTAISAARAATVWTGPNTSFAKANGANPALAANQDRITSGVWLTRGSSQGLYNANAEPAFTHFSSPSGTAWANGAISNFASLTYTDWNNWAKGVNGGPPSTVGVNAVVHLIAEDIYIGIRFTSWTSGGAGGGFSYVRSTAPVVTPTVSTTNPPNGAVFAAPASVLIQATAAVTSGSVTNVGFFANGALLGNDSVAPFSLTTSSLAASNYALTAVATAAGVSATSSVVNISVVTPVSVLLSAQRKTNDLFSFDYAANPGLSYLVQRSSNLLSWVSVLTNTAASNPVHYSESFLSNQYRFFRVGRMPNP
jgi:hypothetical protein